MPRPRTLPIRTRYVVTEGGTQSVHLTVFCPRRMSTTDVVTCASCPRRHDDDADHDRGEPPSIRCHPDAPPESEEVIGALVSAEVACVHADVPLEQLVARLARPDADATPIVGDDGRLLGLVTARELDACRREPLTRFVAKLRGPIRGVLARDVMARVVPLEETATIGEAIRRLASTRSRRLPVVDRHGVVVGIIEDVSLLHGYATRAR